MNVLAPMMAQLVSLKGLGYKLLAVKFGPADYLETIKTVEGYVDALAHPPVGDHRGRHVTYAGIQIQVDGTVPDGQPLYIVRPIDPAG